jgi:predicted nucleotidyltransferase component of viral defense system
MVFDRYVAQVQLLVRILPFVDDEAAFALKGGTAINLFYRDMPRLSVDIDLVYLPIEDRPTSLHNIDGALDRIAERINAEMVSAKAERITGGGQKETRLLVRQGSVEVKVETSPVLRGTVHPVTRKIVTQSVQAAFGFAEIPMVSFEDLFAGKITAALDRQHPRDLYDVKLLYENEGLTDDLFRTFLIYLASSGRPPHELLDPNLLDLNKPFASEFEGMTHEPVAIDALVATRKRLITEVQSRLDISAATFLRTLIDGDPDFEVIGLPQGAQLPAVRWKVQNLLKFKSDNPAKHAEQRLALEKLL